MKKTGNQKEAPSLYIVCTVREQFFCFIGFLFVWKRSLKVC